MKSKVSSEKNWVQRMPEPLPAVENPGETGIVVVVCR